AYRRLALGGVRLLSAVYGGRIYGCSPGIRIGAERNQAAACVAVLAAVLLPPINVLRGDKVHAGLAARSVGRLEQAGAKSYCKDMTRQSGPRTVLSLPS